MVVSTSTILFCKKLVVLRVTLNNYMLFDNNIMWHPDMQLPAACPTPLIPCSICDIHLNLP